MLAGLMRSLSTKGRGERQLLERQLQKVNGKTFYPRRAAKNGNCNCRTATATPFSTEDTKDHGERQLQKVNGKPFYPRRAAKDHEGPRRTATAEGQWQTPLSTKGHEERQLQNCNGYTFLFAEDIFGAADCGRRTGVSGEKQAMAARRRAARVTFSMVFTEFQRFLVTNDKLRR